ncbi:MAG: hypothetical protein IPK25_18950 [Saprospiraceae bacterium]|nr:hypothetical protein [Saprospiraceae bacterium]
MTFLVCFSIIFSIALVPFGQFGHFAPVNSSIKTTFSVGSMTTSVMGIVTSSQEIKR